MWYPECNSTDVDTIRCNLCAKWVCEGCQDVSVAKLKRIFNKCKTIDQLQSQHSSEVVTSKYLCGTDRKNSISSKKVVDRTVKEFESKLETSINKKLDQKLKIIVTFNENIKEQGSRSARNPLVIPSFADKLRWCHFTSDSKWGETTTKRERTKNFIIHGLEEKGDTSDENYGNMINRILSLIGMSIQPTKIICMEKKMENKPRTLKIEMNAIQEVETVWQTYRASRFKQWIWQN